MKKTRCHLALSSCTSSLPHRSHCSSSMLSPRAGFSLSPSRPSGQPTPSCRAIHDTRILSGLRDSLGIAVIVSLLSLVLGFPAARVLGLRQFRGRQFAWLVLFLPTVVPPLAIGMGLNILFLQTGLAGTLSRALCSRISCQPCLTSSSPWQVRMPAMMKISSSKRWYLAQARREPF